MNKDTLRNLLVASAVFLFIVAVGPSLLPPPPSPPPVATTTPSGEVPAPPAEPGAPPAAEGEPPSDAASFSVRQAEAAQTFEMGAALSDHQDGDWSSDPYRMRLELSNVGASIESAQLIDHAEHIDTPQQRYRLLMPLPRPDGAVLRSLAVEKINLDGVDITLHDKRWHCEGPKDYSDANAAGQSVAFQIEIVRAEQPVLRLIRTWRLPQQPEKLGRHDLLSELSIVSLSSQPHRVVVTYRGGVGVPQDRSTDDRVIDVGVQTAVGQVGGSRTMAAQAAANASRPKVLFAPSPAAPELRLSWAAIGNTYFTCTVAPLGADAKSAAPYMAEVSMVDVDGDPATIDDPSLRFVTAVTTVQPQSTLTYPSALYVGEKDGKSFRHEPDYLERNYYYQISQGFGVCTFTFLVEFMIWLLNSLHVVVRDFGVAIIIMVLLVRALLHPLTKKGQINMARMQRRMSELAPKIEEIKKKYANDKARMNQEMMKLNLNPAGQLMSCLPMLIQMPIWVALYLSLSNNILMRHEPVFLTWIKDLTAPDALIPFASPVHVPLFGWRIASFNLLPILVSVFMYLQQKTAPKPPVSPNMSDEQRQQQEMMQKMMPLMSIMMLLIFYNMPSGLNLYIMFSSLFGWLEQVKIRRDIKRHEADGTLFAGPKPPSKPDDDKRKPGKPSWFDRLQKMAEDAQKAQHTQRAAKPKR